MSRDLYVQRASPGQEWMWLIHQMRKGPSPYHIGGAVRIRGPVDLAVLGRCLELLVARHEALRTVFRFEESGELSQVIREPGPVPLDSLDPPDAPGAPDSPDSATAWALDRFREFSARPFDLAEGPLLRAGVARIAPGDHLLGLVFHHIVSDGWSMDVVTAELVEMYRRLVAGDDPDLPEPALQYADFSAWYRDRLASGRAEEHLEFWRRNLEGASPVRLPADQADPSEPAGSGPPGADGEATHPVRLGPARTAALAETARAEGVTLFMLVLSAFAAVLARWSGQRDFVLATPVAGRSRAELEGTVGFFVNTLPIRVDASGDPTLRELLRRVRRACLDAYDHQDVPYETIVRKAAWRRDGGQSRLGPVMFALRNPPVPPRDGTGAVTMELIEVPPSAGEMDVFAELVDLPGRGLHGYLAGDPARFRPGTMALLADSFTRVLTVAASGGGVALSELPVKCPVREGVDGR
ncbi:condensation domain-containing protein [Actinomadura sp. GTD37]|uniref:condensation domain-containing protein n=1 Tax=Actinomadura sp. GTD37 TaxID=1778030 RepID=UPI0035BEDA86